MRFAAPAPAYDDLRIGLVGTAEVPWPSGDTGSGTLPETIAAAVLAHVADHDDPRLRLLVGDDAPEQFQAALDKRINDYRPDSRWSSLES